MNFVRVQMRTLIVYDYYRVVDTVYKEPQDSDFNISEMVKTDPLASRICYFNR